MEALFKNHEAADRKEMSLDYAADLAGQTALLLVIVWFFVLVISHVRRVWRTPSKR